MQFVDKARIVIKAGDGGDGCASFHREKFVTRGGPDGGDGGRGGNVVFVADSNMDTLLDFKFARFYRAENGEKGRAARSSGKNGQDLIIKVPVGTLVRDVETGAIAADPERTRQEENSAARRARRQGQQPLCNAIKTGAALCSARAENA